MFTQGSEVRGYHFLVSVSYPYPLPSIRIRIRMIVEKNIHILSVSVYQFLEITSLAS